MALNKVMLIGNIGQDPEVRYTDPNSGTKVATLRLATTERYKDRAGETRELTEWHTIVAWRNLADLAEKFIKKGSQIYVEGRLRTRSWDDQNHNKRYVTEILADNIQLLGRKSDNPSPQGGYGTAAPQNSYSQPASPANYQQAPAQPQAPISNVSDAEDDDLPF